MKKLFAVITTPFWMVNIDFVPQLNLRPVQEPAELRQECIDLELSAMLEDDPAAYDFLRRLPRDFLFKVADAPKARPGISLWADPAAIENLELVSARDSISAKAARLGLPSAGARIETHGNETFLKVAGKDLVCDLIRHKVNFKAKVPMKAGPSREEMVALSDRLHSLKQIVLEALKAEDPRFAALLIGYQLDENDQKFVFEKLVNPKTMQLSENWEIFGGTPSIKNDISKDAGLVDVALAVPYRQEGEIAKLEARLATYRHKPVHEFSAQQRSEFEQLNQQRANLLRQIIMQKLLRKKYVF